MEFKDSKRHYENAAILKVGGQVLNLIETHQGLRSSGWRALTAEFAAAFDFSAAAQALTSQRDARGRPLEKLGEGMHFAVFALGDRLVLKVPTDASPGQRAWLHPDPWLDDLRRLRGLGRPWMAPFEVVRSAEAWGLVTPRFDGALSAAAPCWQPLECWKEDLLRDLACAGLTLGDVIQAGTRRGVPFVYDWSDLRPVTGPARTP